MHAQNALMVQSQSDSSGKSHANGWGVATFEGEGPHIEKQAWAAFRGAHFQQAAARIYSRQVLAHVRRATVGEPDIANTHPFKDGGWAFAHNGTIPNFEQLRPLLLAEIPTDRRGLIKGETDSEHMFQLVRARQLAHPERPAFDCVRESVQWIVERSLEIDPEARIGLNIIMTDGNELIGTRLGRPLQFVERDGIHDCEICGFPHVHHNPRENYRAIILASEPISHEHWRELPDESIYRIGSDCRIAWEAIKPRLKSGRRVNDHHEREDSACSPPSH
ncbi:class II glutamine amidotransferase [Erythrobacter insulae]|uniref:class II glutamine amidotransferase n=1 Tax=Erythrobacter insulae TaxID=2584124 RepID=UPI001F3C4B20